ncbi:PilZ domain-containing protein [Wenzhouxiangella marina]|uniref:Type IV pilus assembly PilZ n=1 Tax=Wenzhouxiangella marina TaxID=1579979 RepID=A0A0K0XW68_9GAMM|nr:PilZ domain-containing protein [Wenzhouxiangella marina]AKS41949.1 Type IV pilus assembly PilZ [Wenzhouxiangella marina]MBB6086284.1 type IV pilus assembly protein PilZ [Wenzhouxiangella marina]
MAQKGILSYSIENKQDLYAAYMPFLTNGGLFVPTKKSFKLGDEVLILLSLLGEERIAIPGQVAWITPLGSQHSISPGVGVHFADSPEGTQARNTISSLLAGMLESDKPTRTI